MGAGRRPRASGAESTGAGDEGHSVNRSARAAPGRGDFCLLPRALTELEPHSVLPTWDDRPHSHGCHPTPHHHHLPSGCLQAPPPGAEYSSENVNEALPLSMHSTVFPQRPESIPKPPPCCKVLPSGPHSLAISSPSAFTSPSVHTGLLPSGPTPGLRLLFLLPRTLSHSCRDSPELTSCRFCSNVTSSQRSSLTTL